MNVEEDEAIGMEMDEEEEEQQVRTEASRVSGFDPPTSGFPGLKGLSHEN